MFPYTGAWMLQGKLPTCQLSYELVPWGQSPGRAMHSARVTLRSSGGAALAGDVVYHGLEILRRLFFHACS